MSVKWITSPASVNFSLFLWIFRKIWRTLKTNCGKLSPRESGYQATYHCLPTCQLTMTSAMMTYLVISVPQFTRTMLSLVKEEDCSAALDQSLKSDQTPTAVCYGMSLIVRAHTVLPATGRKWTRPILIPARQLGIWFTYPGGMEGWVNLGDWHTNMVYPYQSMY